MQKPEACFLQQKRERNRHRNTKEKQASSYTYEWVYYCYSNERGEPLLIQLLLLQLTTSYMKQHWRPSKFIQK